MSKEIWNSKCPKCGSKAYFGFSKIECGNKACENYKELPPGSNEGNEPQRYCGGESYDCCEGISICPPPRTDDGCGSPDCPD